MDLAGDVCGAGAGDDFLRHAANDFSVGSIGAGNITPGPFADSRATS